MKKYIITLSLFAFSCVCFSQTSSANLEIISMDDKPKAAVGSYQFLSSMKIKEIFTVEYMNKLLVEIEENRHQTDDVYLDISESTRILIFSKENISNPNFVKPTN